MCDLSTKERLNTDKCYRYTQKTTDIFKDNQASTTIICINLLDNNEIGIICNLMQCPAKIKGNASCLIMLTHMHLHVDITIKNVLLNSQTRWVRSIVQKAQLNLKVLYLQVIRNE